MTETSLAPLAHAMIEAAQRAGAEAADALVVDGTSLSIGVLKGALEQAERAEGIEIGLRVTVGPRQATVSASDTRPETLAEMAERAVAMARLAPEDATVGLADADQLSERRDGAGLDMLDPNDDPDPAALEQAALRAEAAALAVSGVSQVQSASAGYSRHRIHLAATNGFSGGYARSDFGLSCVAITGKGLSMERDYFGDGRNHAADLLSPEEIGRRAAERAVARANARQPKTGAYPVIYDERISSGLIGHLLAATNGSAIVRGASWARDLLGQQVLPTDLDLVEDPHRPRTSGSRPFDAEGLPTTRRAIVENGVLTGWTLDLATGRKLGLPSTGNAARGTGGPPSPSVGNIALTQGDQSLQDLMAEIGTGLLVTSLIGSSINATTGDYSRGASGFWIEGGEIAYPVNECTIAGNLRDMLLSIRPANDARTHLSRVVPSLLVEGMTLAGA
ncbi:TldE/PmbA protein, part of proposed TldE/TldD proteolytic complex [Roseibacterium elongatum DSM 19469]|uniref:TldE/PmbA protein, part of proposed TldE/TldD proteolytic complex n=1 Tax=Roseicyclus elongatus DSM 19469 TaxID=1294273 RepID=W8RZG5_9RHOB|nr:TldD/PmbA family protein [Roseibacterium elongatum]AHM03272.1 TldE/PmbA protein, part of proposed TldE/TldD proteolytic complex [Roseibacterium elongatum DSM 19469]